MTQSVIIIGITSKHGQIVFGLKINPTSTLADYENIIIWFKKNPKFLQVADHETYKFLNQKARISAAIAASSSEDDFVENLQDILHLLQQEKESNIGKQKQDLPSSSSSIQNEEDYYGIFNSISIQD